MKPDSESCQRSTLVTNLDAGRAELLRRDLAGIPAGRLEGPVTVIDRSTAGGDLPEAAIAPCPSDTPPVNIADLWEWDRRRQSYIIGGTPVRPVIAGGGAEGAMYGFYAWLRAQGGRRWPYMDDTANPAALPSEPPTGGIVTPAVAWRGFEGALARWDPPFLERLMRWMLRNGWNLLLFNAAQWRACPYRETTAQLARQHGIRLVLGAHAVDEFLPETLFATHPEYFGLRDGVRAPYTTTFFPDIPGQVSRLPVQPCYGNPATRRFLAERIAAFIDETPEMTAFSLWPHDGSNNWCECPDCACDTPYRLMHALAREILACTRRPVPIELLSYCNLLTPPTHDLPYEPRVYTLFCPYLRHYRHPLDAPGFPPEQQRLGRGWPEKQPVNPADDREYGRLFDEWRPHWQTCGSGVGVFAYYQLAFADHTGGSDRSRYLYLPDLGMLSHEIGLFHRSGMGAFYDCSWPLPGLWPDARFATVLSRLLWDPGTDAAAVATAFYTETLGAQGTAVQEMLGRLCTALNAPGRPPLPPALLDEAEALLSSVPGPAGTLYGLWLGYVRLADRSWQARRAGDSEAVRTAEEAIQKGFKRHRELLAPRLQVDWMERLSKSMAKLPCPPPSPSAR